MSSLTIEKEMNYIDSEQFAAGGGTREAEKNIYGFTIVRAMIDGLLSKGVISVLV